MNAKRKNRGFSLGELLIVIGVISLLAAILFPVLSRAREAGLKTSALSNIRQVGTSEIMYAGDYDDYFTPYFVGYDPASHIYVEPQRYWPQLATLYLQASSLGHGYHGQALDTDLPKVFFDPILPVRPQPPGDFGYITSWGLSDSIADWVGPLGYTPSRSACSTSELNSPSSTYLLVETRDYFRREGFPGSALALAPSSNYFGLNASDSTAGHYFGQDDFGHIPATGNTMICFTDGHVASRPATLVATRQDGWHRTSIEAWP